MNKILIFSYIILLFSFQSMYGSKFISFQVVDEQHIQLLFYDGEVLFHDTGKGPSAFLGHAFDTTISEVITYGNPFNLKASQLAENWSIISPDDANYSNNIVYPLACFRQSKINGDKLRAFKGSDFEHTFTYQHIFF
ncbi:MAG: hypothetical protein HC905_10030 [Bacteroidales bacterium]|nr:hypothetical protein [Bacteroidales bacterium]